MGGELDGMLKSRFIRQTAILLLALIHAIGYSPSTVEAGNFRIRAREDFERLTIRFGPLNRTQDYFGLTSTINAWYEEPFHYAFGLVFNSILFGDQDAIGTAPIGTPSEVRLLNIGLEAKYFFFPKKRGLFGRAGLTSSILDTRSSLGTLLGGGYYLGLGWEARVWRIGIAPEVAFRHVILEQDSQILAFTPTIGVHFYVFPRDMK